MRLVGALGIGETPSADEQTVGLSALNAMLEEWSTDSLAVYELASVNFTWTGTTRTIGATGDVVAARPDSIDHAFQRENGVDHPINIIRDENAYSAIASKSVDSTIITNLWYDPTFPNGTLYAYPVPTEADVHLRYKAALQSFASASTSVSLPPGYQTTMEYGLAIELAPEYQRNIPLAVQSRAASSYEQLSRTNLRLPVMVSEPAYFQQGSTYNIYRDG